MQQSFTRYFVGVYPCFLSYFYPALFAYALHVHFVHLHFLHVHAQMHLCNIAQKTGKSARDAHLS